jgi:hypothetical protein
LSKHLVTLLPIAAAVCLEAVPMYAQTDPGSRIGLGVGLARGSMSVYCNQCAGDARTGGTLIAQALAHVSPSVDLGMEGTRFSRGETHGLDETSDVVVTVAAVARWHPPFVSGLTAAAGAGFASYEGKYGTPSQNHWNSDRVRGVALQAAVGYERRLVGHWAVEPFASYLRTIHVSYTSTMPGPLPSGVRLSLTHVGLLARYRAGP